MGKRALLVGVMGLLILISVDPTFAQPSTNRWAEIRKQSAEDHQKMMQRLGIASLRPGRNGMDPNASNYANYDETKANPYPDLPDPLVLDNGREVVTAEMWWQQRRPEIVEDFDREIYGRVPRDTPKVAWEVTDTNESRQGDIPVITRQLVGHVDNRSYPAISVEIQLTVTTPARAAGPVPLIMEFGFGGRLGRPRRGQGPSWQDQVLALGWGFAILVPNSIQADNGAGLNQGIIGLMNRGQARKVDDWGALRAWAWGASRALDYFEKDPTVDARQVGLEGHSRYGKATLVAMAYDPRFAVAFVSSSGAGGASLWRRDWGEIVENVAGSGEYHWMAGNFIKYAGPLGWDDLPIDAHQLVALCAPRPVFISSGSNNGDAWVDAKGMFLAAVGAGPVYRLLGKTDMGTGEFPPIGTGLMDGDVSFRQHSGGHSPGPNWPTFLDFAGRYLQGPASAPGPTAALALPLLLRVVGTEILNSDDEVVRLRGVNCASLEWTSNGEGHIVESVRVAIDDWKVNHIRLPLSQDRWFGKAPEQKDQGQAYRAIVDEIVQMCAARGVYIMLELHWSNTGIWGEQIGQHSMPDEHSVTFWQDLAPLYANHPAVIYDLYNEPHDVSWDVWLKGGEITDKPNRRNQTPRTFKAVGMQELFDTVRGCGAMNLIVVGGLDWAYDFSGILEGRQIQDPDGQGVIYANHCYNNKNQAVETWIANMEKAAARIPIIISEFGGAYFQPGQPDDSRRGFGGRRSDGDWLMRVMHAIESHEWSYTAWDFHPAAGPTLISNWDYEPTPFFGAYVKQMLVGTLPVH